MHSREPLEPSSVFRGLTQQKGVRVQGKHDTTSRISTHTLVHAHTHRNIITLYLNSKVNTQTIHTHKHKHTNTHTHSEVLRAVYPEGIGRPDSFSCHRHGNQCSSLAAPGTDLALCLLGKDLGEEGPVHLSSPPPPCSLLSSFSSLLSLQSEKPGDVSCYTGLIGTSLNTLVCVCLCVWGGEGFVPQAAPIKLPH